MQENEIESLKNVHELLKYVCYNKTSEMKKFYLQKPKFLKETWDFLSHFNQKVLNIYKKICVGIEKKYPNKMKRIVLLMHMIFLNLPNKLIELEEVPLIGHFWK